VSDFTYECPFVVNTRMNKRLNCCMNEGKAIIMITHLCNNKRGNIHVTNYEDYIQNASNVLVLYEV
jgi:hypothetical protein